MTRLIEIEGIDGAGKTTLTKNLVDHYGGLGKKVFTIKFPDEGETQTGRLIRAWLKREWTTGDDLRDAFVHQCLQIVNRLDLLPPPEKFVQYDFIFLDRYYSSTLIYGEMDGLDAKWLEHVCSMLPQPNLSLLLDIPVSESFRRKPVRDDRYEERAGHMTTVMQAYRRLFERGGRYHVIEPIGMTKEQVLREALRILEAN